MNKAELINAVSEKSGLSKRDSELAVSAAIDVITDCLSQGDKVQLPSIKPDIKEKYINFIMILVFAISH